MDASPRSSTDSDRDSFVSGRSSPLNGFDSSAALILVPDVASPSSTTSLTFNFDVDGEGDDASIEVDEAELQLARVRSSAIPPLSSFSAFLYLLAPYLRLGVLLVPATGLPTRVAVPTLLLFAALSAFTRQIWYMLARYVRRADMEEIVLETFARGRGKQSRRAALRQAVRSSGTVFRIILTALYLRYAVDLLLPCFPDALVIPSRAIATIILAAFVAPIYAATSLASRRVVRTTWISVVVYVAWFSVTTYMHAKHIMVPTWNPQSLGQLWQGIPALAFTFTTTSTVPLYASLKGTIDPLNIKSRRLQSFKLLSVLSVAISAAFILPLAVFGASLRPRGFSLPTPDLQTTVSVFAACSLILSIPALLIPSPAIPLPYTLRRAFPSLSKVLIYLLALCLSVLPARVSRVGSDVILVLAFLSTYVVPALLHIVIHNFRQPLSIVVPPTTPTVGHFVEPSESLSDELLQAKERTLQRRRLWRRLIWDVGVWVLLLPVGGGGVVWAAGRIAGRW
ncbi:uncharacterized protein BXZ73DRAFT_50582 [Epithele typhae]|uniref:uncharacterized protein n=1 Tax=Epithele typhae TaxID=378194 RepID=UPI002008DA9F|nr:uncharacterized protein BXZ73DRAFT_50582 [Epithele typhae]KAH9924302.1 hypothetical protein BXZ73DRAFT_50582 [Epithele typhae]